MCALVFLPLLTKPSVQTPSFEGTTDGLSHTGPTSEYHIVSADNTSLSGESELHQFWRAKPCSSPCNGV